MNEQQSIQEAISGLGDNLRAYLEAQYHVRDESVLNERKLLLSDSSVIAQEPFLEATPAYELTEVYANLGLPVLTTKLLTRLAQIKGSGVYPRPYGHQAKGLAAFLNEKKDILAATGTGSGKTEIFLLSILGSLAEESSLGQSVTKMPGCRALILYPMNALVADQLARMRKMLGNDQVAAELKAIRGKKVRFGMYTSRTPFAGEILSDRNKERAAEMVNTFYQPLLAKPNLVQELQGRGKWPVKDLPAFFGKSGTRWQNRLRTSEEDVELLMRHEIQRACPELLITNYSMLEYMLLRPIERSIFDQTAAWLKTPGTFFTIVLDEAHMYRGATGAEVSFLLRRLLARLGIERNRVRFIMTTASVGREKIDEKSAREFACDLTGLDRSNVDKIAFIRGTPEKWENARPATAAETEALAALNGSEFEKTFKDGPKCAALLNQLASKLGWEHVSSATPANDLYKALTHFGPAKLLVTTVSGFALVLDTVADLIFPDAADDLQKQRALDTLLRICNFGRDAEKDRVFLPARLHLFFRGLSGLYTCINPKCASRRDPDVQSLLGRLYPEPRVSCTCGSRVFEALTHRDCGALYLKGYVTSDLRPTFMWHEPTTGLGDDSTGRTLSLQEIELLVSSQPPANPAQPAWLNIVSGALIWSQPTDMNTWLPVYARDSSNSINTSVSHVFDECPQCGDIVRQGNSPSRIMDLRTKGEQPFGQLVKRQLFSQAPDLTKNRDDFPNQGRKVLIFSDGRQKAARLAKDIPEEVEADAFRELLALGYRKIPQKRRDMLSLPRAYVAFTAACSEAKVSPFYGNDAQLIRGHIHEFRDTYSSDLDSFLDNFAGDPPTSFKAQLYKQACGRLYSMAFISAGSLEPLPQHLNALVNKYDEKLRPRIEECVRAWIHNVAAGISIDHQLPRISRAAVAGYDKGNWAHSGKLRKEIADILQKNGVNVDTLQNECRQKFMHFVAGETGYYLKPETLTLRIAFDLPWYRCKSCFADSPFSIFACCPKCGGADISLFDPNTDKYIQSRKGFWRNPVKAAFEGNLVPRLLSAEEHTAQLTHKEAGSGWVKTEEYELRFQDILLDPVNKPAVDVLSCTTTMEVGIDIGSLTAVGLRNVPPQRENYQQRAGRAGRRGSAVSTVVTYCQGGAHDNHYFSHVDEIAAGSPRKLTVKVDNAKIACRHVRSYILQEYFTQQSVVATPDVLSSLGSLETFFQGTGSGTLAEFATWTQKRLKENLISQIKTWVGSQLEDVSDMESWVKAQALEFVDKLKSLTTKAGEMVSKEAQMRDDERTKLLEFLLAEALLPTYAFPTDLTSFRVEEWDTEKNSLVANYAPQQSVSRALSEYAPGRLVFIDKKTYKCVAVTASTSVTEKDRAAPLFNNPHRKPYVFCDQKQCCYVEDIGDVQPSAREGADCPLCGIGKLRVVEMITPEVFLPFKGREVSALDDEVDYSHATPAQFPVPLHSSGDQQLHVSTLSERLEVFRRANAQLVVVNKGDPNEETGFNICEKCGTATLAKLGHPPGSHPMPYQVVNQSRQAKDLTCYGAFRESVFLGHRFVTDTVILRIQLTPPLCQSPKPFAPDYAALHDSLQTLADALPLAAARMFDIDYTEFSAGYRLINQSSSDATIVAELYMFDTLSGGAGYSERVGQAMEELLRKYVPVVLACDDGNGEVCERSCYKCLRHYYNQQHHAKLDRHIAHDLLNLILDGTPPPEPSIVKQRKLLAGLRRMLELDGIATKEGKIDGVEVPLIASDNGRSVALCITHALVADEFRSGLVNELDGASVLLRPFNEYHLTRNLPSCHLLVRQCLGHRHS